jgi:hypothetical protein
MLGKLSCGNDTCNLAASNPPIHAMFPVRSLLPAGFPTTFAIRMHLSHDTVFTQPEFYHNIVCMLKITQIYVQSAYVVFCGVFCCREKKQCHAISEGLLIRRCLLDRKCYVKTDATNCVWFCRIRHCDISHARFGIYAIKMTQCSTHHQVLIIPPSGVAPPSTLLL